MSWWVGLSRTQLRTTVQAYRFRYVRLPTELSETQQADKAVQAYRAAYGRSVSAGRRETGFDTPIVTLLRDPHQARLVRPATPADHTGPMDPYAEFDS